MSAVILLLAASVQVTAPDAGQFDNFGHATAVSGDVAVIGAWLHDHGGISQMGAAYVFRRTPSGWEFEQELLAADGTAGMRYAAAVSISDDTIVIGAPYSRGAFSYQGAVYVYVRTAGTWTLQQQLGSSHAETDGLFGRSVAISGDVMFISANEEPFGNVYVFERENRVWTERNRFVSPTEEGDYFGTALAVSGETALVGGPDDSEAPEPGSVYVYERGTSGWALAQELDPVTGGIRFGASVSISGDVAAIGSSHDNDLGMLRGSVYVFARTGGTWALQQRVFANASMPLTYFGAALAVSGNRMLVGSGSNAAVVFERQGATWTEIERPAHTSPNLAGYGQAVALDGDVAAVGAPKDAKAAYEGGSTYLFGAGGGGGEAGSDAGTGTNADGGMGANPDSSGCTAGRSSSTPLVVVLLFAYRWRRKVDQAARTASQIRDALRARTRNR
jgi:hypothetical protein